LGTRIVIDVIAYALVEGFDTFTVNAVALVPIRTLGVPATVGGAPFAVGTMFALIAFVRAPPFAAKAGKNANELPTRRIVTTSTDSLVVSDL